MTLHLMKTNFPKFDPNDENSVFELFNPSEFILPITEDQIANLINTVASEEHVIFHSLEIVFVSEEEIVEINKNYLGETYVTDIITFRYDESSLKNQLEGTIYCCAPRIAEQSQEFNTDLEQEFLRVVVHGLIHLAGYNDQLPDEKKKMTELEDRYLKIAQKEA